MSWCQAPYGPVDLSMVDVHHLEEALAGWISRLVPYHPCRRKVGNKAGGKVQRRLEVVDSFIAPQDLGCDLRLCGGKLT